jgi:hypothetical protein
MNNDIQEIFEVAAPPPNNALRDQLWGSVLEESSIASATNVAEAEVLQLQPNIAKTRRLVWLGAIAASLILVLGVGVVLQGRKQQQVTTTPTAPTNTTTETSVSSTETTVDTAPPSTTPPTTEAPASTTLPSTTIAALAPSTPAPGAATWESLPSSGLPTRVAALVANAGNRVLVVGGQKELYTSSGSVTSQGPATRTDGAMLDLTTKTWTKIAKAPVPLNSADIAQWDGREVITVSADGTTAAFDPASNAWRTGAPIPIGKGSGRMAAWTGTELLVTGGYDPLPDAAGALKPNPKAAAYRPDTNSWRTIASPSASVGTTTLWTGFAWLTASGKVDYAVGGSTQAQVVETYDPKANSWSKVAGLPENHWIVRLAKTGATVIQQLPANPDAVVAAADDGSIWELNSTDAWRPIGEAHMGDQVSVTSLLYVDGHPIVYADSGETGGTYLGYGQASGAWVRFDHFNAGPDFPAAVPPLLTESGRLLETDGTNAALLAPIVDPTINVGPCTSKDLDAKATGDQQNATITLTNHMSKPCTISGQRPSTVILNGPGHAPLPQPESIFYNRSQSNNGGYISPGGSATLSIFRQQDPTPDGKPCPVRATVDSMTFSLSEDADLVTVPIKLPEGCWDLRAIDTLLG